MENISNHKPTQRHRPQSPYASTWDRCARGCALGVTRSRRRARRGARRLSRVGIGSVGARHRLDREIGEGLAACILHGVLDLRGSDRLDLACLSACTVPDQVVGALRRVGKIEISAESWVGNEAGIARWGFETRGGVVVGREQCLIQLAVLLHQRVVVAEQLRRPVRVDLHQAVVVLLLGPFVDQAAAENRHLRSVERPNFLECAGLDVVAAVLGEEDGHGRVGEELRKVVVPAGLEARVSAPRVRINGKEIGPADVVVVAVDSALQVVCLVVAQVFDIGSAVSDWDSSPAAGGEVHFHVPLNGLKVLCKWDSG